MGWLVVDRSLRQAPRRVGYFGYFGRGETLARTAASATLPPPPELAPAPAPAIDPNLLASSQPLTLAPILVEKASMAIPTRSTALLPSTPELAPLTIDRRALLAAQAAATQASAPTSAPLAPIEIARELARTAAVIAATPASKLPTYEQPRGNPYARGGGGVPDAVTAEASVSADGAFVPAGTPVKTGKKFPWWLLLLLGYGAYRYSKKKGQ